MQSVAYCVVTCLLVGIRPKMLCWGRNFSEKNSYATLLFGAKHNSDRLYTGMTCQFFFENMNENCMIARLNLKATAVMITCRKIRQRINLHSYIIACRLRCRLQVHKQISEFRV